MDFVGIAALVTAISTAVIAIGTWIRGLKKMLPVPAVAQDAIDGAVEDAIGYYKDIIETGAKERAALLGDRDQWRQRADAQAKTIARLRRRLAKYEAVDDNDG